MRGRGGAPPGGDHLLDQLEFPEAAGLVVIEVGLAELLEGFGVLVGEDEGAGGEAVFEELAEERWRPSGVLGPWERAPLARLARSLAIEDMAVQECGGSQVWERQGAGSWKVAQGPPLPPV